MWQFLIAAICLGISVEFAGTFCGRAALQFSPARVQMYGLVRCFHVTRALTCKTVSSKYYFQQLSFHARMSMRGTSAFVFKLLVAGMVCSE
jgi:hypothetical protein